MFCTKCGKEILDEAVVCIHCGCAVQNRSVVTPVVEADAPSGGMAALGFFVPLAGLIIWLVNKDTKPLMAKSAGKGALIGAIVSVALSIVYALIMGSLLGGMMGGMAYYYY